METGGRLKRGNFRNTVVPSCGFGRRHSLYSLQIRPRHVNVLQRVSLEHVFWQAESCGARKNSSKKRLSLHVLSGTAK